MIATETPETIVLRDLGQDHLRMTDITREKEDGQENSQ